jgi:soluble lytic murein transglycosylase-like protein
LLTKVFSILFVFYPLLVVAFCFDEAAREHGMNANLLRSIACVESNNNPTALNHNSNGTVDLGIMQINSSWIKPMGLNEQELLKNPCYNVKTAAKILKQCMGNHGYTWEAIGCYNVFNPHLRRKYSWKVFDELNRTRSSKADISPSMANNASLYFAVRNINEEGQ